MSKKWSVLVVAALVSGFNSSAVFASLPVAIPKTVEFEANRGQHDKQILFLARTGKGHTFLTRDGLRLGLQGTSRDLLALDFVGHDPAARIEGQSPTPHRSNYLRGDGKDFTDIAHFSRVTYYRLFPGVDLTFYDREGLIEYDFVIQPGADPRRIALKVDPAAKAQIEADGSVTLTMSQGTVRQQRPIAHQEINGIKVPVDVRFALAEGRLSFELGAYNRNYALVIDPVLSYSTMLGGSDQDSGAAIAVDANGSAYIAGYTQSTNFPVLSAYKSSRTGTGDLFVAKLNPAGTALLYSTYIGGRQSFTEATSIAVDAAGNAYVTGTTSSNSYPVTSGAFSAAISGGGGVVTKLNASGNALVYSSYLTGARPAAIKVDSTGAAYVAGTSAGGLPITAGALQPNNSGNDGFLTKFNPAGSALVFSTYLGGSLNDELKGLAIDSAGSAVVVGTTSSFDFPTVQPLHWAKGGTDGFIARFDPTGTALQFSTYLGGAHDDSLNGVAIDLAGNVYVGGESYSLDFPSAGFKPIQNTSAATAVFAALTPDGSAISWAEYFGGRNCLGGGVTSCSVLDPGDVATAVAVDPTGTYLYGTGFLTSVEVSTLRDAIQPKPRGTRDAFVIRYRRDPLDGTRSIEYATRLGSSSDDRGTGIAFDPAGNAYVVGTAEGTDFPSTAGAFRVASSGYYDVFVAKISMNAFSIRLTGSCFGADFDGYVSLAMDDPSAVSIKVNGALHSTLNTEAGTASLVIPLPVGVHKFEAIRVSDGAQAAPVYCKKF